jgi:hypothetical protein
MVQHFKVCICYNPEEGTYESTIWVKDYPVTEPEKWRCIAYMTSAALEGHVHPQDRLRMILRQLGVNGARGASSPYGTRPPAAPAP